MGRVVTWLYWLLAGWFALSLGVASGWHLFRREFRTADTPPDPVTERAERVAHAQKQIDAERNRTGTDVITDAAVRFLTFHDPHRKDES